MRLVVSAKRAGTPTAIQRRSQLTSLTSPIGRPFGTRRPRCGIQFTIKASSSAKEAVEVGLVKFQSGDVDKALELFAKAQALNPTDDEARAACYNAACCYTKLKRWEEAADSVLKAVNDYGLKLDVARTDPDLAPLRERREWIKVLNNAAGGISEDAYLKLRSEAKSPFRLVRITLFGTFTAAAALGLLFTIGPLLANLSGVEGAQELNISLQNLAINGAVLAGCGYLVYRDLQGQSKDQEITQKEEVLAQLQISLGSDRVVPLASFRGSVRPVILAGSKGQVNKAVASAAPYKNELLKRGVSLVPIIVSDDDPAEKLRRLKAELNAAAAGDEAESSNAAADNNNKATTKGFGSTTAAPSTSTAAAPAKVKKADRKWQLEPYDIKEWETWALEQGKAANAGNQGFYAQVQLDGSVRASGVGLPPWERFLGDIPELDDVRTKLTDGAGLV